MQCISSLEFEKPIWPKCVRKAAQPAHKKTTIAELDIFSKTFCLYGDKNVMFHVSVIGTFPMVHPVASALN